MLCFHLKLKSFTVANSGRDTTNLSKNPKDRTEVELILVCSFENYISVKQMQ